MKEGFYRQRPGYPYALSLAAAELVGVAVGHGRVEANHQEQLGYPVAVLALGGGQLVYHERLPHDIAAGHPWIQGPVRVLEDELHVSPKRPHLPLVQLAQVPPVEYHLSVRRLVQPKNGAADRGLAASALAHHPQRLTLCDGKADAVHGLHVRDVPAEDDS